MRRVLTIDEEILLNQFSQGIHTLDEMRFWFKKYDVSDQRDIIHNLLNLVIQAHPSYQDFEASALEINKATSAVAVKLQNRNKPFTKFGYEICSLPAKELSIGFEILILTLAKADNRRKARENPEDCTHWWHKDLSCESYLNQLRSQRTETERFMK